jgi:hypothetical protein
MIICACEMDVPMDFTNSATLGATIIDLTHGSNHAGSQSTQ